MHIGRHSFPGRRTLEEWLAIPFRARIAWVWRAQADLLGSFRFCTDKRCRRHRMCCSDEPEACRQRLRRLKKPMPKTLRNEWARIDRLAYLPYQPQADRGNGLERTGQNAAKAGLPALRGSGILCNLRGDLHLTPVHCMRGAHPSGPAGFGPLR